MTDTDTAAPPAVDALTAGLAHPDGATTDDARAGRVDVWANPQTPRGRLVASMAHAVATVDNLTDRLAKMRLEMDDVRDSVARNRADADALARAVDVLDHHAADRPATDA